MEESDENLKKMLAENFENLKNMFENPEVAEVFKQLFAEQFLGYAGEEEVKYPPLAEQEIIIDSSILKRVTPTDFKDLMPLPERRIKLDFQRNYSEKEYERMSYGLMPSSMDEKWIIIMEGKCLRFYQSWSRKETIRMSFEPQPGGYASAETWVDEEIINHDWNSPAYMAKLLEYMIERMLLGRSLEFPFPASVSDAMQKAMFRAGWVGSSLANSEG